MLKRVIRDKFRLETMCFKCKLLEILNKQILYKFKAFYAQANAWEPLYRPDCLAKIVFFQDTVKKLKNNQLLENTLQLKERGI